MATVVDILETRLDLVGLTNYTKGMGQAGAATAQLGVILAGVAVAGFGLFVKAARAAADEQEQFGRAAGNFKGAFPVGEIEAFSTSLENMSRFSDGAIADALGLAGAMGMSASAAKELAKASANAAEATRAKGTTLGSALEAGGQAIQGGQTRRLRALGIFLDQTAFAAASTEERLRMVTAAMNGLGGADAAERGTKTLSGSLDQLNNALANVEESFGKAGGGPLTQLVQGMTGLVNQFNKLPDVVKTGIAIGIPAAAAVGALAIGALLLKAKLLEVQFYRTAAAGAAAVGGKGGLGGKALGFGLGIAGGLAGEAAVGGGKGASNPALRALGIVGGRAAEGAAIGSMGGAIGALAGMVLGGIVGAVENTVDAFSKPGAKAAADPTLEELKKQTELLKKGFGDTGAVDFNRLSIVQQRAIMAWGSSIGSVA